MEVIATEIEALRTSLESSREGDVLHEDVRAQVNASLAELASWDERKKSAMSDLHARFGEERDAHREQMRRALAQHAWDLTDRLRLNANDAAVRLYYEYPDVPAMVIGSVFGLHSSKVVSLASRQPWPLGGECRKCETPFTTTDRARVARPWSPPTFCTDCHPRCRECNITFDLSGVDDELLDRMVAGQTFRCVKCGNRGACDEAIAEFEAVAGEDLFDVSRDRAYQLFELSEKQFQEACNEAWADYSEPVVGSACAVLATKINTHLSQLGVDVPAPKKRKARASGKGSGPGRVWDGTYEDYLASDLWRSKREWALERADRRCQLCGDSETVLHVHHNSYENLGAELPADLIVLCAGCHHKHHVGAKTS